AAGVARHRRHRTVRVHDRLERVPVRTAVPGRPAREVDGVARHRAAVGLRGAAHRPDGRLDRDDAADRGAVRRGAAFPAVRAHRRCGEGMSSSADPLPGTGASAEAGAWWRDAVIYEVYLRSFADSNGDGVGDLAGLTSHLDHLHRLGVDAVWVTPF